MADTFVLMHKNILFLPFWFVFIIYWSTVWGQ